MGQLVSDVNDILNYQKSKKSADNTRQDILQQIAKNEQTKTNLVKKALATQRAKYGASGVNATSTTAGAVLKRLRDETAQPYTEKTIENLKKLNAVKTNKPNLLKKLLSQLNNIVG